MSPEFRLEIDLERNRVHLWCLPQTECLNANYKKKLICEKDIDMHTNTACSTTDMACFAGCFWSRLAENCTSKSENSSYDKTSDCGVGGWGEWGVEQGFGPPQGSSQKSSLKCLSSFHCTHQRHAHYYARSLFCFLHPISSPSPSASVSFPPFCFWSLPKWVSFWSEMKQEVLVY